MRAIVVDSLAYEIENPEGRLDSALLVCDHASNRIPGHLAGLGVSPHDLRRHIAIDIGAAELARALAASLDVPAVLARWSRLVVDCNRAPDDATAIVSVSDSVEIAGNVGLDPAARRLRIDGYHRPYHDAIASLLGLAAKRGFQPTLIAIHSFTPSLDGHERPWQCGVLWDRDGRLAVPLIEALRVRGYRVGDNQPYSGRHPTNYTVDRHGARRGLPHASIEVRQDLIDRPAGVAQWGGVLAEVLREVLPHVRVPR